MSKSKKVNLVTLVKISLAWNILTFALLAMHFIISPRYSDIGEIFDDRCQSLDKTNANMKGSIEMLGDAQMKCFQEFHEVKDSVDVSHEVAGYRFNNIRELIDNESVARRKEAKKLHGAIKEIDASVKESAEKINSNVDSLGDAQLKTSQEIDGTLNLNRGMFNGRLETVKKTIVDEVRKSCGEKQ